MASSKSYARPFALIVLLFIVAFICNVALGSVSIPFAETLKILVGQAPKVDAWQIILFDYRVPKALTAILVGSGLAISGLLMQTLFRNPLAGPFVLGISSGASLGVALLLMGSAVLGGWSTLYLTNALSLTLAASAGSVLVLAVVMGLASRIRDTMALLIIGLMFGSLSSAVVSILSYSSNKEQLQRFIFWSFGNVGNLSWYEIGVLACTIFIGLVLSVLSIKKLNALLLGENYASSLGVDIKKSRFLIILAAGILAGSCTAFVGPIAFIGLAVPHLTRQLFNTMEHKVLLPAMALCGAILMLVCDILAQLPGTAQVLPINAITSLLGAPVVIWLLVRKKKLFF